MIEPMDALELRDRYRLSKGEAAVLFLLIQGKSNHEIAERLDSTVQAVKNKVYHAFQKAGFTTRADAILKCQKVVQPKTGLAIGKGNLPLD